MTKMKTSSFLPDMGVAEVSGCVSLQVRPLVAPIDFLRSS